MQRQCSLINLCRSRAARCVRLVYLHSGYMEHLSSQMCWFMARGQRCYRKTQENKFAFSTQCIEINFSGEELHSTTVKLPSLGWNSKLSGEKEASNNIEFRKQRTVSFEMIQTSECRCFTYTELHVWTVGCSIKGFIVQKDQAGSSYK